MAKVAIAGEQVIVEKGDTLWDIAEKELGSGIKYKQLAAINNITNPDLISVGQKINLKNTGSSKPQTVTTKITINQFGLQSNADNVLFATWTWSKEDTASYKAEWSYDTGDGVWFIGSDMNISVDEDNPDASKQSTYNIPKNAKYVRFRVKPISKKSSSNGNETAYWTAQWSVIKTFNVSDVPPTKPSTPTVELDKYKLTAELDNLDVNGTGIQFEIVKNNAATAFKTGKVTIVSGHVSYSCTVDAGGEYKVRCRSYKGTQYSDWSDYSNNVSTIPATPSGITTCRATSETSVYLAWDKTDSATSYDIEYATKKEYFDITDQTTTKTGVESTYYELIGLETGSDYFFRIRAVNDKGGSAWSGIVSVVIGKDPAAPTTWSSTTTAVTGDPLNLYWVHNAEDGSSQTYAELELYIDGAKETYTIKNSEDEEEKDKTSSYSIDTSEYIEGTKIQWRVRTAGVTKVYGDWSIERTIDIYAPATLELNMTDINSRPIETVESFPFYIQGLAGPETQLPVGYHLAITTNSIYETTDRLGNPKTVNKGDAVYSKYFDTQDALLVELSAGNIDLENNIEYTVTCTVSMNSGLTAQSSLEFTVSWTDEEYLPNAEISIDKDTFTAYIKPYCERYNLIYHKVDASYGVYLKTEEVIETALWGTKLRDTYTLSGEEVYSGMTADGDDIYYCIIEESYIVEGISLSVYRREFDGGFTELATGLDNAKGTTISDPHPALDFARYRIVATSDATGAVSYYDLPGYPVGGTAVIIQWDEAWTSFDTSEDGILEQPPWAGSMLKLPYNVDVSDSNKADVSLIEYIGRAHPVTYYGTQLGQTSTWNVAVEKDDEETLYALRRLAKWMGDAYVREPSGSGYWANISVSFSQKHCELTIPVTLSITRVEGGI